VIHRNVLMVTGAYWPELSGGGLQCRTMIQALRDRFAFRVFTTCTDPSLERHDRVDGVEVTRVYVDVNRPATKALAAFRTIRFFLANLSSFEIVHLHGFSQKSVLLVMLSRLFGKRVVITIHTAGHDEPEAIRRLGGLAYRCYSGADRLVAVSDRLAENLRAAGLPGDRVVVAPNSVDTDRFAPAPPDDRAALRQQVAPLPPEVPWVLFVGFFSREKNPELLFEAWLQMRAEGVESALLFAGATRSEYHEVDAAIADRILARARAAGVGHLVHLAGEVRDVERYYQAADLFVMPSEREAFGMALVEAMSSELPVVATRIEGVTDRMVEDHHSGVLVSPSVDALAAAMRGVLQDQARARQMAAAARRRVIERFGLAAGVGRWTDLYTNLS
jgi:glycosyltransferase involved in cell wall biosynthesis